MCMHRWQPTHIFDIYISWVDRRTNDIANGPIVMRLFHDNFVGSMSLHVVQADSVYYSLLFLDIPDFFNQHIPFYLLTLTVEKLGVCVSQTSSVDLVTAIISLVRSLDSVSWVASTVGHLKTILISGCGRTDSSAKSLIIVWRRKFQTLNSSAIEEIGSCRFLPLV